MTTDDYMYSDADPWAWTTFVFDDTPARRPKKSRGAALRHGTLVAGLVSIGLVVASALFVTATGTWNGTTTFNSSQHAVLHDEPVPDFSFEAAMKQSWRDVVAMYEAEGEDMDTVLAEAGAGLLAWSSIPSTDEPPEGEL